MTQKSKYITVTLNEYDKTSLSHSQCGECALLIDGICEKTCQMHPDPTNSIPPDYWDNNKPCPHRQGENK